MRYDTKPSKLSGWGKLATRKFGDFLFRFRPRLLALCSLFAPRLWPVFETQVRDAFEARASKWDSIVGLCHTAALRNALSSVPLAHAPEGNFRGAILDVGCGTGIGTLELADNFSHSKIVGMDISLAMLRIAATKRVSGDATIYWVAGDACKPPFEDEKFFLIVLMNAPPFLRALRKLLEPGGWMLFVWSESKKTPIWIPPKLIEAVARWQGATKFERGEAGGGEWLLVGGFRSLSQRALSTP